MAKPVLDMLLIDAEYITVVIDFGKIARTRLELYAQQLTCRLFGHNKFRVSVDAKVAFGLLTERESKRLKGRHRQSNAALLSATRFLGFQNGSFNCAGINFAT